MQGELARYRQKKGELSVREDELLCRLALSDLAAKERQESASRMRAQRAARQAERQAQQREKSETAAVITGKTHHFTTMAIIDVSGDFVPLWDGIIEPE